MTHAVGQRLSLKGQLLTVRYVGAVADKPGEWLGVEWDDSLRGKHNGTHNGVSYFTCRSSSPTAASFLRSNQPWGRSTTFLEALREKYASGDDTQQHETIYFSTKQAEEVGFDKFAKRQAELRGIHILVLDRMSIRHRPDDADTGDIEETCKEVTDLDLSSNLFENIGEICGICRRLPRLRSLTLNGNRFSNSGGQDALPSSALPGVRMLSISNTFFDWTTEVVSLLREVFPGSQTMLATNNEWVSLGVIGLPNDLRAIDLSENHFTSLADVVGGVAGSNVETLVLKNNKISRVGVGGQSTPNSFFSIRELDLRQNNIADWDFFNDLAIPTPNLKHLRTSGNPLYLNLKSAEGKHLTAEDGYMLTIARFPRLETLNYSKITDKERLNAETYYLGQIAAELSSTTSEAEAAIVLANHPRWSALCEEYGEPAAKRQVKADELDSSSLAARLVTVDFISSEGSWRSELPKTLSVYEVLGVVGKRLKVMPLKLRLIWETGEQDPMASNAEGGPEWWDSSDDEAEVAGNNNEEGWVTREVELLAGTRVLGTYIEGREARVRIEIHR